MKIRYTETITDLVTRWGLGLIVEPTGTLFIRATKDAIYSGETRFFEPAEDEPIAIWAPGLRGHTALMMVGTTCVRLTHGHRNVIGWNLHKCGVEVIEVESFSLPDAVEILKIRISELESRKTKSTTLVVAATIKWQKFCLSRCEEIILQQKPKKKQHHANRRT